MTRRWLFAGAALVALAAALALLSWLRSFESTDNAFVVGTTTQLGARTRGQVAQVMVEAYEQVEAGQALLVLDRRWLLAQQRQASAELALARAEHEAAQHAAAAASLRTDTTRATQSLSADGREAALDTARQQLGRRRSEQAAAQIAADEAGRTLARARSLHAAGVASQAELDAAEAAAERAAASLRASKATVSAQLQVVQGAERELDIAQTEARSSALDSSPIDIARARLAVAKARLDRARAALELAQLELDSATLRAPADGHVLELMVHVGDSVEPGQRLVMLAASGERWIQAHFEEGQAGRMRPGQRAQVRLGSAPRRSFSAEVVAISDASGATTALLPQDTAVGNYIRVPQWIPVRLELEPEALERAAIGVSAEVKVFVEP